jgi:hypothetical protein
MGLSSSVTVARLVIGHQQNWVLTKLVRVHPLIEHKARLFAQNAKQPERLLNVARVNIGWTPCWAAG